jgi:hypothetical protein
MKYTKRYYVLHYCWSVVQMLCWQDNAQVFSIITSLYTTRVRQQWRSVNNVATVRFTCCSHCLLNCGFRSSSIWPPLLHSKREYILSTTFLIKLSVFEEINELCTVRYHQALLESTIAHYLKLWQSSPHMYSSISSLMIHSYLHSYIQNFLLSRENFPTKFFKNSFSLCMLFHQSHPSRFCWNRTLSLCHFLPASACHLLVNVHLHVFYRVTCH